MEKAGVLTGLFCARILTESFAICRYLEAVTQVPAFAQAERDVIPERWVWLDEEISDRRPFLTGDDFSMADIHGMVVLMLGGFFDISIPPECTHAVL